MSEKFLTMEELAERWRIKKDSIYNWKSRKLGPKQTKIVGKVLFSLKDIEDFENKSKSSDNKRK